MDIELPDGTVLDAPDAATPDQVKSIVQNFNVRRNLDSTLSRIHESAISVDPEKHAEALQAADKLGLPLDVVTTRLKEFQAKIRSNEFDPAKFREENPALADLLMKAPQLAPVLLADKKPLSALEWTLKGGPFRGITDTAEGVSAEWRIGKLQVELAQIANKQRAHTATAEDLRRGDAIDTEIQAIRVPDQGLVAGMLPAAAGQLPRYIGSLGEIGYYAGSGATAGAAAGTLGGPVGAGGGALIGAGLGAMAGVFKTTQREEGALFYRQAIKEGADPAAAEFGATIVGLANGTLEVLPLDKVLRVVPAAKAILNGPTKDIVRAAIKNPALKAVLARSALRMQEGMVFEGITEGLQEIVTQYELGDVTGKGGVAAVKADLAKGLEGEIGQSTVKGYQAAGGMHVVSPGVWIETGTEVLESKRAKAAGELLKGIDSAMKESKTAQTAPAVMKTFVQDLQKRYGAVDAVSVPAGKLEETLKGVDVASTMPDVARQLASAAGPEDEVTVKFADLVTHVAPLPGFEGLIQDVRVGDGPTLREAPAVEKAAKKIAEEMATAPLPGLLGEVQATPGKAYQYPATILRTPGSPIEMAAWEDASDPGNLTVNLNLGAGEGRMTEEEIASHGGKGRATVLYVRALMQAQQEGKGFASDSIRTDATEKMYARLKKAGLPFEKVDSLTRGPPGEDATVFHISAENLKKIDLTAVWDKIAPQQPSDFDVVSQHSAGLVPLDLDLHDKKETGTQPGEAPAAESPEMKAYRLRFNAAVAQAREQADRATAREFRRGVSDDRRTIQSVVEGETKHDPAFNARNVILRGERLDGGKVEGWVKGQKLSAEWIKENVDESLSADLKGLSVSGGVDPDLVAPFLGFKDGKALVWALAEKGSRAQWIRKETNRLMALKYPGYTGAKGWSSENVQRALHTDEISNAIWAGFKAMGKRLTMLGKRAISDQNGMSAKAALKVAADTSVNRTPLWGLSLRREERSEGRAARAAAEAWRARDVEAAYDETRQQLYHHFAWRAIDRALDAAEKFKEYVSTFRKEARRKRIAEGGAHYLEAIDAITNKLGFNNEAPSRPKSEILQDIQADGMVPPLTVDDFNKLPGDHTDLTVAQMGEVHEALQALHEEAKKAGDLVIAENRRNFKETAGRLANGIKEALPPKPPSPNENPDAVEVIQNGLRNGDWHLRKIEFLCRILDGGKTAGLAHELIFQPMVDAEVKAHQMARDLMHTLRDDFALFTLKDKFEHSKKVEFIDTMISRRDVLSIALNMRNEGNMQRMLDSKGWDKTAVLARLDQILDDKDIEVVNRLGSVVERTWPEVQRVYEAQHGVKPKAVKGEDVTLPSGRKIEGGYYPIIKNFDKLSKAERETLAASSMQGDLWDPLFEPVSVSHAFTESRVEKNVDPLLLSIDALPRHLMKVIHYITHYEAVRAVDRLTQAPEVKAAIVTGLNKEAYEQIRPWLKAIARDSTNGEDGMGVTEKTLRHLRVGASIVLLFGKSSVAVKQLLGLTATLKEIGGKYTAFGVRKFMEDVAAWTQGGPNPFAAINLQDPAFELMHENYDREVHDLYAGATASLNEFGKARHLFVSMGMALFNLFQGTVNSITWHGALQKAMDEKHERPIDYANSTVRLAQSSGGVKDLAAVQRGSEYKKMWTIMYSWYSVLYNQLAESAVNQPAEKGRAAKIATFAAHYWWMSLFPAALSLALKGSLTDDSDPEDKLKAVITESVMSTAHALPIMDKAVEAFVDGRDAKVAPWLKSIYDAARAGKHLAEGDDLSEYDITAMINATGMLSHLPTAAAMNGVRYIDSFLNGDMEEPIADLLFRTPREAK
jgi:hypothetical protein